MSLPAPLLNATMFEIVRQKAKHQQGADRASCRCRSTMWDRWSRASATKRQINNLAQSHSQNCSAPVYQAPFHQGRTFTATACPTGRGHPKTAQITYQQATKVLTSPHTYPLTALHKVAPPSAHLHSRAYTKPLTSDHKTAPPTDL